MRRKPGQSRASPLFCGFILLISAGLFYLAWNPGGAAVNAPAWIMALIATIFAIAGGMVLLDSIPESARDERMIRRLRSALGWIVLGLLALLSNWVAFGSGERGGSAEISLPIGGIAFEGGGLLGRSPFACAAITLDLTVVVFTLRWLLQRARSQPR